jgi:hypothetical protein
MGITIGYEGELDDPTRIGELLPVYAQMGRIFGWPVRAIDERVEGTALVMGSAEVVERRAGVAHVASPIREKPVQETIQGLRFEPPGTEPFYLCFNAEGRLRRYDPIQRRVLRAISTSALDVIAERAVWPPPPQPDDDEIVHLMLSQLWVKTTGAIASHKLIVRMLRHLKDSYASNLEVSDDAGYWDSGDEAELGRQHGMMNALIDMMRKPEAMKGLARLTGIEELADATPIEEPEPPRRPRPREN